MKAPKYNHKANNIGEAVGLIDTDIQPETENGKLNWVARRTALIAIIMENPALTSVLTGLTGLPFDKKSELVEYLDKYLSDDDINESLIRMRAGGELEGVLNKLEKFFGDEDEK